MSLNLLLLNHYAGSPEHGMEYRPYYLAREWVRMGHHVSVAAASHSHLRTRQPDVPGALAEESLDGIRYVWLRTPSYHGNGYRRVLNMAAYVAQLYRWRKRLAGPGQLDLVIASSTYPWDIFPARAIARRHAAQLVFEVHDLWPLTPMELGGMSKWHPFIRSLQFAEDYAYRTADRVVSLLPLAKPYMMSRGMSEDKFIHIPNGVDLAAWAKPEPELPEPQRGVLQRLRGQGRFVVGYAGHHGTANALETLLETARCLRGTPACIVLVGEGPRKDELARQAASGGLENVFFLPGLPKDCVRSFLSAVDAAYLGWRKRDIYQYGISPNKLFDYMMASKPVIHAQAVGNDPVADAGCGVSVASDDPVRIAQAIRHLMSLRPEERAAMGQRGREYVRSRHDYATLADCFLRSLEPADASIPNIPQAPAWPSRTTKEPTVTRAKAA